MATVTTGFEHVVLNEQNVPIINGTTMKVIELVQETIAYGWSPKELKFQHPYLTMGQIYSALAYYADHQDELRKSIEERLAEADEARQRIGSKLPPRS